jgi:CRISPR-associated endonuclease/helicase Cas3
MSGFVPIYAHSLRNRPPSEWDPLEAHSAGVAKYAKAFAAGFGAGDWGDLLGRWHVLGKASKEFQDYLRSTCDPDAGENEQMSGRVDHSTFGAQYAARTIGGHFGQLLAFCIAGHHAGVTDAFSDDESGARSILQVRLKCLQVQTN